MASDGANKTAGAQHGGGGQALKLLVQNVRGDLNLLSNEAKKKYPAVRESAERGAMKLKSLSETSNFSLQVLASNDVAVHPLLFACETKNPALVKIALAALQRLIQNKAVPQKSIDSIVATLKLLMENYLEELKIIQTVLLLVTTTEVVRGKSLSKVLMLCFKMYARSSREPIIHNTAGVAIRQIVSAMFERLNSFIVEKGLEDAEDFEKQALPMQAKDAYLLFQDICFLTNGDPPAWLPPSIDLELSLGLELLETVLRAFPRIFVREKLFNQLLTERVCPLIIKLFSPSSKYRHTSQMHSPTTSAMLAADKPTFALSIRLLRILNVLIREFYFCLITQCEIFLSMLVKFLDSDKPLWQRTLAVEVLHSFCNHPRLLKSFCECYDMQEHSTKIFGDIIDALGGFIHSYFNSHMVHISYGIVSSSSSSTLNVTNNSNIGHMTSSVSATGRHMHMFSVKNTSVQVEALPSNAHIKPVYLEMLDKMEVPVIAEGYPLVVAMNALLDAIKSVSQVINDDMPPSSPHATPPPDTQIPTLKPPDENRLNEVMLKSSWSGVLAALALLLDASADEQTTVSVLEGHQTFIYLCGMLHMTSPRDAFLTSLCKAALPPKYAMSLITQRSSGPTKKRSSSSSNLSQQKVTQSPRMSGVFAAFKAEPHVVKEGAPPPHIMTSMAGRSRSTTVPVSLSGDGGPETGSSGSTGVRRKLNLESEGVMVSVEGVGGEGGVSAMGHRVSGGVAGTPVKEQQSALVTLKNFQCIQCLLSIIDRHGNFLDSAWLLVMNATQHIFEMFGLKPLAGGGFQLTGISENSSLSLVSVEKRKDISEVAESLKDLFKTTKQLSEASVLQLITALSQLSTDTSLSSTARENGLFPVTALLEVGTTNYNRLQLIWPPITTHLSKVCSHGDSTLRTFATDALTSLIRGALDRHIKEDVQQMLLMPLEVLTSVKHHDVRQKQLDCINHVLHSIGHSLHGSWSIILDVINSATTLQSETLVRAGFQCLQLVIADFLPAIPPSCLPVCVDVGGAYGIQTQDINISLTSIGLLWNMADYLYQNKSSLQESLEVLRSQPNQPSSFTRTLQNSSLSVFDSVWMLLFKHLSELCVDERAAVRKSASQTLFSTISAHGVLLQKDTWKGVLWQVLFPLLEGVGQAAGAASTSSFETAILIHHSRNTEQKQWAETQVLTLTGTCRLFQSQWSTLTKLDSFERAWVNILDSVQTCACNSSSEVSIAAMKGFQTLIEHQPQVLSSPRSSVYSLTPIKDQPSSTSPSVSPEKSIPVPNADLLQRGSTDDALPDELKNAVWTKAWQVWQSIGVKCVCERLPKLSQYQALFKSKKTQDIDIFFHGVPSQSFLVHLLQVFPTIFSHLMSKFNEADFQTLSRILYASLLLPVAKDVSPFLVPSSNENLMTSVHRLGLKSLAAVFTKQDIFRESDSSAANSQTNRDSGPLLSGRKKSHIDMTNSVSLHSDARTQLTSLYQHVLAELLRYSTLSCQLPESIRLMKGVSPSRLPMISVNYTPVGLGSLSLAVQLYTACVKEGVKLPENMAEDFLKTLHTPLKLKHRCSQAAVWTRSVDALLLVLETSLPQMLLKGESRLQFWRELAAILNDFLFNDIPEGTELTMEKMREYEALDIKVIDVIKRDILTVSTQAPKEFLGSLTSILNRGSIHSATDQIDGDAHQRGAPFRENFARVCFEALLQFSFLHSKESAIATDSTTQLALNALLERCEEVLLKFVTDERLSGACPLPRSRMNEVSLVLKSVTVLITTLKEAQKSSSAKIDKAIWQHVAKLYPALVQCVTCNSAEVRLALREALYQFTDLVSPRES